MREQTVLSRTDNSAGMWWMRKGSAACTSPPDNLLRLQAVHQRHHRYVPRHDFVSGADNYISEVPSCSSALSDYQLLAFLNLNFPQSQPWQMWTPPPETFLQYFLHCDRRHSIGPLYRSSLRRWWALDKVGELLFKGGPRPPTYRLQRPCPHP